MRAGLTIAGFGVSIFLGRGADVITQTGGQIHPVLPIAGSDWLYG